MKRRVARWFLFMLMAVGALCLSATPGRSQTNDAVEEAKLAAEDKEGCIRNLKLIYEAIEAYQVDHKELPNWLSDLVPQYINDANALICPACKRTGQAETSGLADPKIPSSYFFEFCPVPLDKSILPGGVPRTRREWKRRQMGVVGSVVPLVRCRHHKAVLNLAFDGKIYESPESWENLMTNRVDIRELAPAQIFASDAKSSGAAVIPTAPASPPARHFAQRAADAKPQMIDLTPYYNAMFTETWHGGSNNDLASLPTGVQMLNGTEFDVRGIIQLGSKSKTALRFPPAIMGIKVHQKCERLQFLQAIGFGLLGDDGQRVGTYVVHFATNQMQLELPIVYGREARNWHALAGEKPGAKELTVAWSGTNGVSQAAHSNIRLFKTTWVNVAPGVEIESIDFISAMGRPAPFLIAITAE